MTTLKHLLNNSKKLSIHISVDPPCALELTEYMTIAQRHLHLLASINRSYWKLIVLPHTTMMIILCAPLTHSPLTTPPTKLDTKIQPP